MSSESSKSKYGLQKVELKFRMAKGAGIVTATQRPAARAIRKTSGDRPEGNGDEVSS